jgi:hypothetical protein
MRDIIPKRDIVPKRDVVPTAAENVIRADVEQKIGRIIVLSKGRHEVLDKLMQASASLTRLSLQ